MSELLSQCYTDAGHYREAMAVHEEILRLAVEGDDGDDRTHDYMKPQAARKHLDLLKCSYQRLGGWDKSLSVYQDIVAHLINMKEFKSNEHFKNAHTPDKWNVKEDAGSFGKFAAPEKWEFVNPDHVTAKGEVRDSPVAKRPGLGTHRASSNWGMGLIHRFLHGDHDHENDHTHKHHHNGVTKAVGFRDDNIDELAVKKGRSGKLETVKERGNGLIVNEVTRVQ